VFLASGDHAFGTRPPMTFLAGSGSAKDVNGTTQRLVGPSQRLQCGELTLRMFVTVPMAIINASYEAAFLELSNPGSLSPVVTGASTLKREKIGGGRILDILVDQG
jgi:hypothetical protein